MLLCAAVPNSFYLNDFKTDEFDQNEFSKKVSAYSTQMEFYAVLIKNYFGAGKNIELILFFVRYPDRVFTKTFSKDEINEAEKKFSRFIDQLTDNNFQKKFSTLFNL